MSDVNAGAGATSTGRVPAPTTPTRGCIPHLPRGCTVSWATTLWEPMMLTAWHSYWPWSCRATAEMRSVPEDSTRCRLSTDSWLPARVRGQSVRGTRVCVCVCVCLAQETGTWGSEKDIAGFGASALRAGAGDSGDLAWALPPFVQAMTGCGYPLASHWKSTVWPSITVLSFGVTVNCGRAAGGETWDTREKQLP